jgi:hypothetical protein
MVWIRDVFLGSRIPDPIFSISDLGLRVDRFKFSKMGFSSWVLGSGFFPSRIRIPYLGVKQHQIPDPDPLHW